MSMDMDMNMNDDDKEKIKGIIDANYYQPLFGKLIRKRCRPKEMKTSSSQTTMRRIT